MMNNFQLEGTSAPQSLVRRDTDKLPRLCFHASDVADTVMVSERLCKPE